MHGQEAQNLELSAQSGPVVVVDVFVVVVVVVAAYGLVRCPFRCPRVLEEASSLDEHHAGNPRYNCLRHLLQENESCYGSDRKSQRVQGDQKARD